MLNLSKEQKEIIKKKQKFNNLSPSFLLKILFNDIIQLEKNFNKKEILEIIKDEINTEIEYTYFVRQLKKLKQENQPKEEKENPILTEQKKPKEEMKQEQKVGEEENLTPAQKAQMLLKNL